MIRSVVVVLLTLNIVSVRSILRKDPEYWNKLAADELKEAVNLKWNQNTARNVILFIGDGMGPNTVTAARIHRGGESHKLSFEKFPHMGLLKTYSANKMVPDSASTATALLCGVKVNQNTVAVDASVNHFDCAASLNNKTNLDSLAALALKAGKSAGFVTTMRVTHATPGPMYAHSAARQWECDANINEQSKACKDIARQMVEDWPGRDLQVILGGGRQSFMANATGTPSDPINSWTCSRKDGRDLIEMYKKDKEDRNLKYSVLSNNRDLKNLNVNETDYLLGLFSNEHLPYESHRDKGPEGMPSISEMVEAAIKVLDKNRNGYFLMVEGGKIDMAHHRGRAKEAVSETSAMDDAVMKALELTDDEETLIVVTSDHSHTMSINGYADRGGNIFGTVGPSKYDGVNYTVISYGTGGPGSFKHEIVSDGNGSRIVRKDPSTVNTDDYMYEQISGITLDENSHGGSDVTVYANGPFSHLFHSVHEQHYVFHAISYAAKLGDLTSHSSAVATRNNVAILSIVLLTLLKLI